MRRALLCAVLVAACSGTEPSSSPRVLVAPILDSLFVADTVGARTVTYLDAAGDTQSTGPVRWTSSDTAVFGVDSISGIIAARSAGAAVLSARANGVTGTALLVVTKRLDLALLLDTILLMPGDTFTVPASVRDADGSPPPVWFDAPTNAVFNIDSATGVVTALAQGGPLSFTAHADSISVSGAVEVIVLTDTTGGKAYFTVLGSAIRRARTGARALHYLRDDGNVSFRLTTPIVSQGTTVENIVLKHGPLLMGVATFIGAITPEEALGRGANPICGEPHSWAVWSIQTLPPIYGLSTGGGFMVQSNVPVNNGRAISGSFTFTARRADLYDDPLANLPVRVVFVAPFITDNRPCRS